MEKLQNSRLIPTQPGQRVQTMDVLRGVAILGILTVNMELFFNSFYSILVGFHAAPHIIDQLARWAIAFFSEGKFYTTFSILFGMGMAIQFNRSQEKGTRFGPFYLRRMLVLLVFGLIHAYLFWVGDILTLYATLGIFLLIFFRNRRPKTYLVWAVICLLIPILINAALFGLVELARMAPEGAEMMDQIFAEQISSYQAMAAQADQAYSTGTFLQATQQRVIDMNTVFFTWPFMGFNVLAAMLLGLYAGKRGIFEATEENRAFLRRLWVWGLVIGVAGNLLYVFLGGQSSRVEPSLASLLSVIGQTIGAPALSIFYMTSLAFLFKQPAWHQRLAPLANVGRMAITNYLLQTLICTTLAYGYGFGLYGKIGAAAGLLLAVVIYLLQILFSAWWLSRFRYGPVEWLWRSLTYMKRQAMKGA